MPFGEVLDGALVGDVVHFAVLRAATSARENMTTLAPRASLSEIGCADARGSGCVVKLSVSPTPPVVRQNDPV